MTEIEITRERIRQFKNALDSFDDPETRRSIKNRLEKNQFRLFLLIYKRRIEIELGGIFDAEARHKLYFIRELLKR